MSPVWCRVPVMRLAGEAGLYRLVADRVSLPGSVGANPAGKIASIVAGMIAGADSIDDLDIIRHGGMRQLSTSVYAPSTLGSFLRGFTFGHVRQVQSVATRLLVNLVGLVPETLPVGQNADATNGTTVVVDVDSVLRRVYGKAKQGAAFGHTKVGGHSVMLRGLNPLIATVCTPGSAPMVAATRVRAGNASSGRGAARLVADAVRTAFECATVAEAMVILRADSAFYSRQVIWAARRNGARFSVTVKQDTKVKAAIAGIGEDA